VSLQVFMAADNPHVPIIGVVGNTSEASVRDRAQPTVFYGHRDLPDTALTIVVRSSRPRAIADAAVNSIHAIDPKVAVSRVRTFNDALADHVARERLTAIVSGGFATFGLLLASIGLYGLLAFTVAERRKEFGIRIALGAQVRAIVVSVLGGAFALIGLGAIIGVAAALLFSQWLAGLLYGVSPYDLPTYGAVLGLLGVVAGFASCLAAFQVTRVEPLSALRQE
jgi:ABC-type antimicrobial peptide transport system permease subunit